MALMVRKTVDQEKAEWTARLHEELRLKRIMLPSLPEVTKKLRDVVGDNNASVRLVAQTLSGEPALVARIMKAGSSALLGLEPASNLESAIIRLGMNTTRGLVFNYCLSKLFKERHSGPLREELRKVWMRATLTGGFAQMVAARLKIENSYALLGGLVHNVGALPVISLFSQQRELAGKLDLMRLMMREQQAPLGEIVVRHWGMSDEVVAIPRQVMDESLPASQLGEIVRVALRFALCYETPGLGIETISNTPAAQRLKIDTAMAEQWLMQARKEMSELQTLLFD